MNTSQLQRKATALINLDTRRRAHHRALSSLHDTLLPSLEAHEARGLKMWRKLKKLETEARQQTVAQNNGDGLAPSYFQAFEDRITADVAKVFGGKLPEGFMVNHDPRGYALKIRTARCNDGVANVAESIPHGMETDWGGYGLLAAEISI